MLIDSRNISTGEIITCDICIVGAGAAGITLAHELRDCGMTVVLLESGGMQADPRTSSLDQGEVDVQSHAPLEAYRRRRLGGATTAWGGRCVPFDPIDFKERSHVPYSGWPITRSDLDPYYARAHTYCDIGTYSYSARELLAPPHQNKPFISGLTSENLDVDGLYLFSPPTDFGKSYLKTLNKSPNIRIFQYATCLKIETNQEGSLVERLQVSSTEMNLFYVQSKHIVLAAGGLEVTRLLLLSNDIHQSGIGNQYDLLGRFYIGHINHHLEIQFTHQRPLVWDYEKTREGVYCQRRIAIAEDQQWQYGLLNQRFFVERPNFGNPKHGNGMLSATYLTKTFLNRGKYKNVPAHIRNVLLDFGGAINFAQKLIRKRVLSKRKLPSVIASSNPNFYTLRVDSEQCPNPDSRITLSDRKDLFGLNQIKVDWRYVDLDVQSIEKSTQLLNHTLTSCGVGRVVSSPPVVPRPQGGHHLGTTRMASTPQDGVVDAQCKVHGLHNLYIASSSVFPTASYANPTLTIVALAIRLADHLKRSS